MLVDQAGHHFLARTALAEDQYGDINLSQQFYLPIDLKH